MILWINQYKYGSILGNDRDLFLLRFYGTFGVVRIFKNTWFTRYAGKEGISDNELAEAVKQLEAGQADANLGGNVYKLRVARSGEGKSSGYRVIVLFRK